MKKYLLKLVPIAGLIILFIFVFWPLLRGSVFLNTGVIYSDLWLFNFPLKDWYRELLLVGKFPFWTSLVGNGYPVLAEGQIGAFYPFHLILFRLFPTYLAFNLNIILHYFLAGLFTYLFGRVSLKLSKPASLLAAIVYGLSGFFITHTHQINILMVIAYFPLSLMLIERLISTKRVLWSFILALVVALQILAGHIEMFYYSSLLGAVFFVIIGFFLRGEAEGNNRGITKSIIFFIAAYILGVGISLAQILPTAELTGLSQRAEGLSLETASATTWPVSTLALFVNPKAFNLYRTEPGYNPLSPTTVNIMALYGYVGILTLVFALTALVFSRKRYVFIFGLFLLLAFLYGIGRSTQLFAILWETVPGLKFFRYPVKIMFFIEFCLAILAGFGLDFLRGRFLGKLTSYKSLVISLALVGIIFIDLYANNVLGERKVIGAKEWLSTPETADFIKKELGDSRQYRIYSHGTNNIDYQMARNFPMQQEIKNILPVDFNLIHKLPENREWFVLFLERQTALNSQRTSLDTEKGTLGLNEQFKKSLALQGVKYLVADLPIIDTDLVLVKEIPFSKVIDHYAYLIGQEGPVTVTVPAKGVYVYEYAKVYPRALFSPTARVIKDKNLVLETILREDFDPYKEVVVEEDVKPLNSAQKPVGAKVEIVNDQQDSLEVKVTANQSGYLVLADTYYPGWRAEVDGKEVKIYHANYAFRAVPVEAGNHIVRFSYLPTNWETMIWLSAGFLLVTLAGLGICLVRKK